jgi:hypothetical protein
MTTTFFRKFTLSAMAVLLGAITMNANTIDTFDFTQGGWTHRAPGQFTGVVLTGTFTGMVEPSGLIEAADLTNFSAQLAVPNGQTGVFTTIDPLSIGGQPFFSYNVNGGASSLDFVASGFSGYLCEGAVTTLSPRACFLGAAPANAFAASQDFGATFEQATITLASSVVTNPSGSPSNPVPEPGTVAMLGIGCVVLGAWRRRNSGRNSSSPVPAWIRGRSSSGLQLANTATPAWGGSGRAEESATFSTGHTMLLSESVANAIATGSQQGLQPFVR